MNAAATTPSVAHRREELLRLAARDDLHRQAERLRPRRLTAQLLVPRLRRREPQPAELVPAGSLPVSSFSSAYSPTEYCIIRVSEIDERSWPTSPAECQVDPWVSWNCSTSTESVHPCFARW